MTDAYSRTWTDYQDDLDAEALNDLEARMEARDEASAGGGGGGGGSLSGVADLVADYSADPTGAVSVTTGAGAGPLNDAIGDINANTIDALWIPPGIYTLDVVPDAISGSDWVIFGAGPSSRLKFKSTAAHGTFFKVGVPGGTGCSRWMIRDLQLSCNASGNIPPNTENAFVVAKGGTGMVKDIICNDIGGLCTMGTTTLGDRMQLYSFQNIRGAWNKATPNPDRIHIVNATDGLYNNIRLTTTEVNGGRGVYADPTSLGVDQHIFSNCEIWSMGSHSENIAAGTTYDGIDWNVELKFDNGSIVNWQFSNCVFDEGRLGAIYIHGNGSSTCKQVQFTNMHCETNAGNGLKIVNSGSQEVIDVGMIGGRIRHKDSPAVVLNGANIFSCFLNGTDMLQEQVAAQGSNSTRDSVTHSFKHGRSVDDEIHFVGAVPAGLTAGTTSYYVKNADANSDGLEFTVSRTTPSSGGTAVNITGASVAPNYRIAVSAHVTVDAAQGLRLTGCYGGMFEGGTYTEVSRFVTGAGSGEDHYAITGNVAPALQTGFTNLGTSASKVIANNAT